MNDANSRVVIGMDPHKRSVTIEVMTANETILGGGRFGTDEAGFAAMRRYVSQFPDRVWAIEGCNGIGHHVAMRLLNSDHLLASNSMRTAGRRGSAATRHAIRALARQEADGLGHRGHGV